ncbi:MAG TPA: VTT domain-containing protein [Stellaceae bacterium]|nr:VTT domain-containing protein [Stellaceae bacterium]
MPDDALEKHAVSLRRMLPLALLLIAGGVFLALGGHRYFGFAALAQHRRWLAALVADSELGTALAFVGAYAGLTALSVPGAAILTIAGGFLFGTSIGTLLSVLGASLGASLIFLAARAGLAGLVGRIGPAGRRLEAGFRADAFNYLLALRLVPIVPFWLVNLVAGAAGMKLLPYVLATVLGIIPAGLVYASLGSGLGALLDRGEAPDLALLFRPGILLPISGLAFLVLLPPAYRRWRGKPSA